MRHTPSEIDPAVHSYHLSKEKQQVRELLSGLIPVAGSVLTFAGLYGKDAIYFWEKRRALVHSIEHDANVFEQQKKHIKNRGAVTPCFGEAANVISSLANIKLIFDLVHLDFCGPYNKLKEDAIHLTMRHMVKKNGHLALTLMAARDGNLAGTQLVQNLEGGKAEYLGNRMEKLNSYIWAFSLEIGKEYKLKQCKTYHNDTLPNAPQMMFCLFKRNK